MLSKVIEHLSIVMEQVAGLVVRNVGGPSEGNFGGLGVPEIVVIHRRNTSFVERLVVYDQIDQNIQPKYFWKPHPNFQKMGRLNKYNVEN